MLPSRVIILVAFLLFPAVLFSADIENDKKKDPKNQQEYESVWMKRKLQMSQQIMEGLSRGDLDSVGNSARTM